MKSEKVLNLQKESEQGHHLLDATIWNEYQFRADDIIINAYSKSGTTWVQQIIAQLLWNGSDDIVVAEVSPWIDCRFPSKEERLQMVENQAHRRFLKSHLPANTIAFSEKAKYLYIGRDGRDVLWSLYNHHQNMKVGVIQDIDNTPERVGPPLGLVNSTVVQYYREWLEKDGYPWWPYWEHIRSWWDIRDLPNVLLLHFAKLKEDMPGEIRRIAAYLDLEIDETKWSQIVAHSSFEYMQTHAEKCVPFQGDIFTGGAKSFMNKGVNGRWYDLLTSEEIKQYEKIAEAELGAKCARWLATGELEE